MPLDSLMVDQRAPSRFSSDNRGLYKREDEFPSPAALSHVSRAGLTSMSNPALSSSIPLTSMQPPTDSMASRDWRGRENTSEDSSGSSEDEDDGRLNLKQESRSSSEGEQDQLTPKSQKDVQGNLRDRRMSEPRTKLEDLSDGRTPGQLEGSFAGTPVTPTTIATAGDASGVLDVKIDQAQQMNEMLVQFMGTRGYIQTIARNGTGKYNITMMAIVTY